MLQGRVAVQGNYSRLEEVADGNILRFSKAERGILYLGWNNVM